MYNIFERRIRDPYIFAENGKYYLLCPRCLNGDAENLLELSESSDLKNFKSLGGLVSKGYLEGYKDVWAPELHKYNGKYYIIVSLFRYDKSRGSMIFVSDTLSGKYRPLTGDYVTPRGWRSLDASLFVWKGKPYIYFSNEWVKTVKDDGDGSVFVAELSEDLTHIVGEVKKAISGRDCGFAIECVHGILKGYVAEAPFLQVESGKIALYWSTFTKKGYCVVRSVADDVFSEYKFDRFIFTDDGGHAMIFNDFDGKRIITFHQPNSGPNERIKFYELDKM